jgi:uncharacterized membrane protein YcjF (UPF0283 family)
MKVKRILQCLLITLAALTVSLPAQSAMVGTAQMQSGAVATVAADMAQQREWIQQQLVQGGVEQSLAHKRVAAMTDDQVAQIHQRMDEMPAGASGAELIIIVALILVITELMGYTDIIPNWPAK